MICSAEFLHCLVQRCYHLLMILQLASYSMPFSWLIEIQLLFESEHFAWKISVYSLAKGELVSFMQTSIQEHIIQTQTNITCWESLLLWPVGYLHKECS